MTKVGWLLACLGLGLSQAACGPGPAPADPSFKTDVLPIMLAHCVRCHGAGGTLNPDPGSLPPYNNMAPLTGFYDSYDDFLPPKCPIEKCYGAKTNSVGIQTYVHYANDLRMPPRPSLPLSDYELEVIDNWAGVPPAAKKLPKP